MSDSIMLMLRDGTAELHSVAEKQPFQRALIKGELSPASFGSYLGQMLLVHGALEEALARCGEPVLRRIVTGEQFQAANLKADLAALGASATEPLPATRGLVEAISACHDAASLLGHLYVLEGSKNGNAFVARAVRGSLGLTPGQGDRYLDPHGAEQRPVWAGFKTRMDAETWTQTQRADMLAAAKIMFAAIGAISAELEARRGQEVVVSVEHAVHLNLTR